MKKYFYDTERLKCRPLGTIDFRKFADLVMQDEMVQRFFKFGNSVDEILDFLENLKEISCFPLGIYSKTTNVLVGYINGYLFEAGSLVVEYLIFEPFRRNHFMHEALTGFLQLCRNKGFSTLRFDVDYNNDASLALLENLGAEIIQCNYFDDKSNFACLLLEL